LTRLRFLAIALLGGLIGLAGLDTAYAATPPSSVSVSPAAATVTTDVGAIFTANFSDPDGWEDLRHADLLVTSGAGQPRCRVRYNHDRDTFQLLDGGWSDVVVAPASTALCQLDPTQSSYLGSGNDLAVSFHLTFTNAFQGRHGLRLKAQDDARTNSARVKHGFVIVEEPREAPTTISVVPGSATVPAKEELIISATFSDANGWENLRDVELRVETGANPCRVRYRQNSDLLQIFDVFSGNVWRTSGHPGGGNTRGSHGCALNPRNSSVSGSGDSLTVNFAMQFQPDVVGELAVRLKAKDDDGGNAPLSLHGSVTVGPDAPDACGFWDAFALVVSQRVSCRPEFTNVGPETTYAWTASGAGVTPTAGTDKWFDLEVTAAGSLDVAVIACNGANCTTRTDTVEVRLPGELTLDPTVLHFAVGVDYLKVDLTNTGDHNLSIGQIEEIPWLELDPPLSSVSSGLQVSYGVTVDRTGLLGTFYSAEFSIFARSGEDYFELQPITVTMDVDPPPP
jgi:hypothetical protein